MSNANWTSLKMVYRGVEVTITQEDLTKEMKPYLQQAKTIIDWGLNNDFIAIPPRSYGQKQAAPVEYAETPCPQCGKRLVKSTTKNGKKLEKCETQKYANGVTTGCSYTKWIND